MENVWICMSWAAVFFLSIQKIPLNFIKHTIQPWIDDLSKPKTIIINIEFITMIINHLDFFGNHNSIESIHFFEIQHIGQHECECEKHKTSFFV